jgi:gamma-glutamyltranspeptidase / glutathione hydrolase
VPSRDVVVQAALKISEGHNSGDPATLNLTTHHLDESMKSACGEDTNLGDSSFVVNIKNHEADMLDEQSAEEESARIRETQIFSVSYYNLGGIQSLETDMC